MESEHDPPPGPAPASTLERWVPLVGLIRRYQRAWLRDDLIAAIVLTALLVPQGMAYAELAGLPAVTGLYTTIASLLGYALFGPSRILILGPDSSLAPVIAAIIAPLVIGDSPGEAITLAAALAIMAGLVTSVAGAVGLGSITDLLSMPVRVGYLNGLALLVLVSQLPKLFGFSTEADGFGEGLTRFVDGVDAGQPVTAALALGVASLAIIVIGNRLTTRVPWVLLAVVGSILMVATVEPGGDELARVGNLPAGLPLPSLPLPDGDDLIALFPGALAIAALSMADTAALSRSLSAQRGEQVDQNREAMALGATNIACGLIGGFPTSASSSRTVVATSVGSRSQLTGLVAGTLVTLLLVAGHRLLADLPSSVLAAVVIVASFGLFDPGTVAWLAKVRPTDLIASLMATVGVLAIGVLDGLLIAIGTSLAVFIWKRWRPYTAVLGRLRNRKGYHDLERHPDGYRVDGLVLFRFDSPLFFANAPYFEKALIEAIEAQPYPVRRVVLAAEAISDVDSTGNETLALILDELDRRNIELAVAEMKGPVKDRLKRYGLYQRLGDGAFYSTVGSAVTSYSEATGVPTRPHDWDRSSS